jgi:hypothetical protein
MKMATDKDRSEMLARDLTGALMGVLSHMATCPTCWERWLDTLKCMEEQFNATNRSDGQSDQEPSEDVEPKVPDVL